MKVHFVSGHGLLCTSYYHHDKMTALSLKGVHQVIVGNLNLCNKLDRLTEAVPTRDQS